MQIPHRYTPRIYQAPFYNSLADGFLRSVAVWHRRCGKDFTAFNMTIKESLKRIGTYFYFFPTYAQGRKTIWEGFDYSGQPFLSCLPPGTHRNETEMKATLPWGSVIRIIGTDKFDSIVGPNPVGCVFSEFALQDPRAHDLVRPILAENKGWAAYVYTPRGKNHGHDVMERAKNDKTGRWFYSFLTVKDTIRDDGTPVVSEADIDAERQDGMPEDLIQQEFYCSFDLGIEGSYYAKQMALLERQGRVLPHLFDAEYPVFTAWDLGVGDSCAIWFFQLVGNEIRWIDYYEHAGEGMDYYFHILENLRQEMGYRYHAHYAPHDVTYREKFSGRSIMDQAADGGFDFIEVPRDYNVNSGIMTVRALLQRSYFDEHRTADGRKALINYRKEFNAKLKVYSDKPLHNWASHGADAFRCGSSAIRGGVRSEKRMTAEEVRQLEAKHGFNRIWSPLS